MSLWEKSFALIGLIAFITTLLFGHQNIMVALYGCIPFWFGLPLCFIIGKKLQSTDLFIIFRIIIYTGILNSILMIIQFNVSPSHILNFTGGEENAEIANMVVSEMAGMFRPSGLFVHNTQSNLFMLLNFALILYFFIKKNIINSNVLLFALGLEVLACICSASRTCIMLHLGLMGYFLIFCINTQARAQIYKLLIYMIPIVCLVMFSTTGTKAISNLEKRFEEASKVQYGNVSTTKGTLNDIFYRNIGYNIEAIINPRTIDKKEVPTWGFGQGLSTQIGGRLIKTNQGRSGFALAEFDGLRIMCESGILIGWSILFFRLGYVFRFLPKLPKYKHLKYSMTLSLYPPFFVSFYLITTWGNVFMSNFAFLCGGLFLAALRIEKNKYINEKNIIIPSNR